MLETMKSNQIEAKRLMVDALRTIAEPDLDQLLELDRILYGKPQREITGMTTGTSPHVPWKRTAARETVVWKGKTYARYPESCAYFRSTSGRKAAIAP
jgi:hypothetical protein